jgi:UDP-3-O-[3-hydroxymyristoyl] glucosamine N-acyltransferase
VGIIDNSALIEVGANLGDNISIWQYSHIREGSDIGSGSIIGRGVYIGPGVQIGKKLQNPKLCSVV